IGAGGADHRPAFEVDAAHRLDRERDGVVRSALHQPGEALLDADDIDAVEPGANRRRADDAVDAGGRPAADHDCESLLLLRHGVRASWPADWPPVSVSRRGLAGLHKRISVVDRRHERLLDYARAQP